MYSCNEAKTDLLGYDIRLFKEGPAWELAQAVKSDDTTTMKKILEKDKSLVKYREPKFGESLLLWAVWTGHLPSSKVLLDYGADPNQPDNNDGNAPVMYAANNDKTSDFLKLLLKYKANPNFVTKNDSTIMCTPLIAASANRLESVKLLVDAGAEVNYIAKNFRSPLQSALKSSKPDIVIYLLEKGAVYDNPLGKTIDGKDIMITDLLRTWTYPLNSKEYQKKMEIVKLIKSKGLDYSKAPIPEHYYKNYSQDYLSKY
jgi:ankyrin repeat protein